MSDFGTDLSSYPDLDLGALITGPRVLLEALARRLTTPPGTLPEDPEYGYDARQLINGTYSPRDLAREERRAAAQCEMDERVLAADVRMHLVFATGQVTLTVRAMTASGPFSLTLDISQAAVVLTSPALPLETWRPLCPLPLATS